MAMTTDQMFREIEKLDFARQIRRGVVVDIAWARSKKRGVAPPVVATRPVRKGTFRVVRIRRRAPERVPRQLELFR